MRSWLAILSAVVAGLMLAMAIGPKEALDPQENIGNVDCVESLLILSSATQVLSESQDQLAAKLAEQMKSFKDQIRDLEIRIAELTSATTQLRLVVCGPRPFVLEIDPECIEEGR